MQDFLSETWRDIRDHPHYEVSNTGSVRNRKSGRLLKSWANKPNGYAQVELDGKKCLVHRLVADAFFSGGSDFRVEHIDGNRSNNELGNLLKHRSGAEYVDEYDEIKPDEDDFEW